MDERRDDERIARYRAAWAEVRAAVRAAQPLLDGVEPAEMARLLAVLDEPAAPDHRALVALLDWYRSVLLATYRERERQRGARRARCAADRAIPDQAIGPVSRRRRAWLGPLPVKSRPATVP